MEQGRHRDRTARRVRRGRAPFGGAIESSAASRSATSASSSRSTTGGLKSPPAAPRPTADRMRGRWTFDSRSATPELAGSGSFRNINIASFLRSVGHANVASGAATGEFRLQSRGSSVHAMMQNASGKAQATIRAPEIIGVDLERALRRTERRPLSIPAEMRTGQTTFLSADIEASIDRACSCSTARAPRDMAWKWRVTGEIALARPHLAPRNRRAAAAPRQAASRRARARPHRARSRRTVGRSRAVHRSRNADQPIGSGGAAAAHASRRPCQPARPPGADVRRRETACASAATTSAMAATNPISSVEMALISGVTPRRTEE